MSRTYRNLAFASIFIILAGVIVSSCERGVSEGVFGKPQDGEFPVFDTFKYPYCQLLLLRQIRRSLQEVARRKTIEMGYDYAQKIRRIQTFQIGYLGPFTPKTFIEIFQSNTAMSRALAIPETYGSSTLRDSFVQRFLLSESRFSFTIA